MFHTSKLIRNVGIGIATIGLGVSGLVIVAAGPASAGLRPHGTPPLDHFLCYQARGAGFKVPSGIFLKNPIQPAAFTPKFGAIGAHCNPANKIVPAAKFPAVNPLAHLMCWGISAQAAPRKVTLHNQFGKAVLTTGTSPSALCLPTWKDPIAPPNQTPNQPPKLDHFTCYPVTPVTGAYGLHPPAVKAEDEFSAPKYISLKLSIAKQLCVPTTKFLATGQPFPPQGPTDLALLCFPTSPTPIWKLFYDQNQFGQGPVAPLKPTATTEKFCVPTTIDQIV